MTGVKPFSPGRAHTFLSQVRDHNSAIPGLSSDHPPNLTGKPGTQRVSRESEGILMNGNAFFSGTALGGHSRIDRLNTGVHDIRRRGTRISGPTTGCRVAARIVGLLALSCAAAAWPQDAEFIPLGDLAGGDFFSSAYDVSDDGDVVVGLGRSERAQEAMIWTAATGMQPMAPPDATYSLSRAVAVSGDGRVVAGENPG
jgi:hypothetical protein